MDRTEFSDSGFGRIGPGAKNAAPALIAALKDQKGYVRRSAAEALGGFMTSKRRQGRAHPPLSRIKDCM